MRTDRRGFLRALTGGVALLLAPRRPARASQRVLEIHRATRNTPLRAFGESWPRLAAQPATFKRYPGRRRIELVTAPTAPSLPLFDAIARATPAQGFAKDPLSLEQLVRLLYFSNGVTGQLEDDPPIPLRTAPSAGALYACEVYALAQRVRGLDAGLYYYDVLRHSLVALRPGARLDARAAFDTRGNLGSAAAFVLITSVFPRYHYRYADRGYRYALIDTGHIGENLRLAAVSAGLGEARPLRFNDDALNDLLEVDGREEALCAIHAVGVPAPPAARPRSSLSEKQNVAPDAIAGLRRAPQRYHEATKLVPGGTLPAPIHSEPPSAKPPGSASRALPAAAPPAMSAHQSIRERRSPLRFAPRHIGFETIASVLRAATGSSTPERTRWIDLYLVANRVTGLAPGLYRVHPREHRLATVRPGDLRKAFVRACLAQEMAGTGAAGCLMVGRLSAAAARDGDRSYRDLLVEAGEIGERIYLAAEANGLAARNLAAFADDDLNDFAGLDGRNEAVVHLTMLGVPG